MVVKILLNACCEQVELNTSRQNLRYGLDTGVIRSDTEEYARCLNCGDVITGELYVDCGISTYTGTIKTQREIMREEISHMPPISLDGCCRDDKTGMSE